MVLQVHQNARIRYRKLPQVTSYLENEDPDLTKLPSLNPSPEKQLSLNKINVPK
jgi:hypothetical protein